MRETKLELEPNGVEMLPAAKLILLAERRLVEGQVLERAARSTLYDRRWRKAGVTPGSVRTRADLRNVPFTSASDIQFAQKHDPIRQFPCAEARIWFATSTQGEGRKWIPYGKQDVLQYMGLLIRIGRMVGLGARDLFLAVAPPPPRVTNALPYLWMYADILDSHQKMEFIVGSMMTMHNTNWLEFAQIKQPTTLLARPSDALACAKHLAARLGVPETSLRGKFERLRIGLFFGEPLAAHRKALQDAFGLESFDCYLSAEYPGMMAECSAHNGLHIWLDLSIAEIIPRDDLAKQKMDSRYTPKTVFLDQASPGLEGELVITTFGEALPLVRYRTGDLARVVSTEPCACGITHPRLEILGRNQEY